MNTNPSIQDFSTVNTFVEKFKTDYSFNASSNAFYYLALNLYMDLQDDEIADSITDNFYLSSTGQVPGHDRGIDAVYINESGEKAIIHLFNFKYATTFEKTKSFFPSGEIDKILSFLNSLMTKDSNLENEVNPILFKKVEEIWNIFDSHNPCFVFHICSNLYEDFEANEKTRFENGINLHSNFEIKYHKMQDLVKLLTKKGKKIVNANVRAIDKNFFEKSDGDIRALIVNIDIRDLLRIVIDNDEFREKTDNDDYSDLKNYDILEDAFEDNVRIYLKQRSKINRNIKATALSDEAHRFFYYNNGITLTCDLFSYPKTQRSPIVELKNVQVVNGSQTIHALHDAYCENSEKFEDLDILCRIYQTNNPELTTRIAEYTNSQNPVSSRDIRSVDFVQQKLEKELHAKGYFYERKKGQFSNQNKSQRIDAEKTGQVLLSFLNRMPSEAKNQKKIIFADKYEEIFNDSINADKVLLGIKLFEKIETDKNIAKENLIKGIDEGEKSSYMSYASYWVLFFLSEFAIRKNIQFEESCLDSIWNMYYNVQLLIEHLVQTEKEVMTKKNDKYSHITFFKYNRPKKLYEDMSSSELEEFLTI